MDSSIQSDTTGRHVELKLRFKEPLAEPRIQYVAAAPPDYRMSFSGSALPFANAEQAFASTPNRGEAVIDTVTMSCTVKLMMPNSYMVKLGSVQVPPTVFVSFTNGQGRKQVMPVKISDPVPFRMLTYPSGPFTSPRSGPGFYDNPDVPIGTQEDILRASAYPEVMQMPTNFWGKRPPM